MAFKVRSLHAGLKESERAAVAKSFREDNDIQILVCSYNVSALGLNLHTDCWNCVLFEAGKNTNTEIQGYGRLRRLNQRMEQHITRLYVVNTINCWQEGWNLKKMRPEIAGWGGEAIENVQKEVEAICQGGIWLEWPENDRAHYRYRSPTLEWASSTPSWFQRGRYGYRLRCDWGAVYCLRYID